MTMRRATESSPHAKPGGPPRVPERAWRAITSRDARADGRFVYAVRTTGIFCRPWCPSRLPRRENVAVFADAASATSAGFRACLRCHPAAPRVSSAPAALGEACRRLAAGDAVRCGDVARALALSPAGLVRVFRAHLGITPSAYRRRVMAERARATLAGSRSVLDAAEGAGFGAPSRFYASVGAELGMAAARARRGGEGERVTWVTRPCSLGRVLVAWTARGACHVGLGGRDEGLVRELRSRFPRADVTPGDAPPWLELLLAAVDGAAGAARGIPLDVHGTAFQERVWRALARISPGETRSYEEIAASLGAPHGARAVARACATNGLAVLVPCHRVVRKGGALAGYRWGLARKRALLARERAAQEDGAPLPLRTGTASPRVRARGTDRA